MCLKATDLPLWAEFQEDTKTLFGKKKKKPVTEFWTEQWVPYDQNFFLLSLLLFSESVCLKGFLGEVLA